MDRRDAMKTAMSIVLVCCVLLIGSGGVMGEEKTAEELAPKKKAPPKVEVMFVLDTTGSMGSLIAGAKVKIWKIVNQIVTAKPTPDLKVGLVAYRDRGDRYITKLTPLNGDLDAIYGVLRGFQAGGGGDTPESVNEALHVALTKPAWSTDKRTLRIIYLVGDAPPHMDYEQDVKYPVTCEAAARAGIIINTIQCGSLKGTEKIWNEIAKKAEGRYVRIKQSGGMTTVTTPYDEKLARLDRKLSGTALIYGSKAAQRAGKKRLADADDAADAAPPEATAERAGYRGKSGKVAGADLIEELERGDRKLADLEEEKLPENLKKMKPEERKAHVEKVMAERKKLRAELVALDKKRTAYIKDKLAKEGAKGDSFDEQVLDMLREQAKRVGIEYEK
jgi:Mg-chelatase subunit ChlD